MQLWKVPSPFLQILTNIKVKANSSLLYNVKLKKQAIQILHDSNNEYCEKWKTILIKQAKGILDIPNSKSIALIIKENIELQIEICFER